MDGSSLIIIGSDTLVPNYPPTAADQLILSIAKSLDSELDNIVNLIIPPFSEVMSNRLESKSV